MEFYQSILYFYFFTLLLMFRYIGQLLKLSMKTIFSDAIINDPNTTLQPVSLRNMPILGDFPLRLSVSPQKRITSKKFFYPVRNKSFATQQMKPKQQLEALLKRQKVVLMTQRNHINDLLMPLKAVDCEKQLMAFPALQIKKAIELKPNIENSASKNDKSNKFQFKLNSIRKDYHSNILGSLLVQNSEYNQKNWESQKKNQESQQLRKSVIMPKISTKKAHPPMSPQKDSKLQQSNPEVSCPSPSVFNRNRSQFQIQPSMPAPQKKKYRKGYLSYEVGGIQLWKKLKNNIQNPPKISVDKKIITAKTFFGLDLTTFQPIIMENAEEDIQIASLSKIMTCYLTIMIGKKYEVDLKNCIYRVPDWITQTPGTSAQLEAGDVLSAYDLLYALMLPSGNDASICLAELMGKVIQRFRKSDQNKSYTQAFLAHMNFFSKQLELSQQWGNSSGLSNNPNFSTAKSIVALAALALRDETFRKVVSTQQYEINIKNDRYGLSRKKSWKNTNKLLQKGWDGVKTGTTESAGHCLMAKKESVLLGVFDCQTLSKRFSDAIKLNEFINGHCF